MDIQFRTLTHTYDEISLGHSIWFNPISDCDAISVSANTNGFTPLISVAREFGWNRDMVINAAEACNKKGEVCIATVSPMLFMVPTTKGKGNSDFLIHDLISATRAAHVEYLHFCHYGFIQGKLPVSEVVTVLGHLLENATKLGLKKIVVDIDARVAAQFYKLLRPITPSEPSVRKNENQSRIIKPLVHNLISKLRKKYKPDVVKVLFVAESPPESTEDEVRFFYNPNQEMHDHMYRSVMKAVFPEYKYIKGKGDKAKWLTKFMNVGYYMIDATAIPVNRYTTADRNRILKDSVKGKLVEIKRLVSTDTAIILVKRNVFSIFNKPLRDKGFNVIHDEPIPFPSHGHQIKFIEACRYCLDVWKKSKNTKK